jgi:predicted nucleotidyltransferase
MNAQIEAHREELTRLCERFQVSRLELFGSAAAGKFEEGSSDLDFLVDFHPLPPGEHAETYFGLLEALQDLFQRSIDLVETGAIRNPYFKASVDRTRVLLYAA